MKTFRLLTVGAAIAVAAVAGAARADTLSDVQKRELIHLRDRLFDLSSRNRSLKLNKLDLKWAFDIHKLASFGDDYPGTVLHKALKNHGDFDLDRKSVV